MQPVLFPGDSDPISLRPGPDHSVDWPVRLQVDVDDQLCHGSVDALSTDHVDVSWQGCIGVADPNQSRADDDRD
jgi:hypothetical protein